MKKVFALTLACVMLFSMSACDSDSGSTRKKSSETEKKSSANGGNLFGNNDDNGTNKDKEADGANDRDNADDESSDTKNNTKASGSFAGTYSGDGVKVEIIKNGDGTYHVDIEEDFHDSIEGEVEGNSIVLKRTINTEMMPEANDPYDERSTITLTKGTDTDGAFTYVVLNYQRESEFYFPQRQNEDGIQGVTTNSSKSATLHKMSKSN